jgi:hypothetical protein
VRKSDGLAIFLAFIVVLKRTADALFNRQALKDNYPILEF